VPSRSGSSRLAAIDQRLSSLGYAGSLAKKGHGKPDGCATFFRSRMFKPIRVIRFEYQDADSERQNSGHIAQVQILKDGQLFLGVANTHLKWDPPNLPADQQYGYRQIQQLLRERIHYGPECSGWVICVT
jgi:hypothetical protein